ncbi:DUF7674 family protein [Pseudoduganella sp. RAF53_2]|uniref:DUF7674 family protein n=1 Tax=unclassified Pseudoduganella TaxID=2637179 RepID=UPI003F967AEC
MPLSSEERDANSRLVDKLKSQFPAEAEITDHWLLERGWDPNEELVALNWVEAFADRTTEAIRLRDSEAVIAQTNFMALAYRAEREVLRTIVDVSYAENLMWDASPEEKVWAWEFIALEIRLLYAETWGSPTQDTN